MPRLVVHGKYHISQIVLLYSCVYSSYLLINLLIFLFFIFLTELQVLQEYGLGVSFLLF